MWRDDPLGAGWAPRLAANQEVVYKALLAMEALLWEARLQVTRAPFFDSKRAQIYDVADALREGGHDYSQVRMCVEMLAPLVTALHARLGDDLDGACRCTQQLKLPCTWKASQSTGRKLT
jgi:hypothetical protein